MYIKPYIFNSRDKMFDKHLNTSIPWSKYATHLKLGVLLTTKLWHEIFFNPLEKPDRDFFLPSLSSGAFFSFAFKWKISLAVS